MQIFYELSSNMNLSIIEKKINKNKFLSIAA